MGLKTLFHAGGTMRQDSQERMFKTILRTKHSLTHKKKAGLSRGTGALVLAIIASSWLAFTLQTGAAMTPGEQGPCLLSRETVVIDGDLTAHLYFPTADACSAGIAAPYPAIAFAHGFSMFGLSNGAQDNAGNGEHLASWGYVVAIPELPDDFTVRLEAMQEVLSYLETEAVSEGSVLYQRVDTERLAVVGHSLGGATALALAGRDARVKAVVALDPVYHTGGFGGEGEVLWNPEVEAPRIAIPTGILGAPSSSCNAGADYADIYPWVGATHKASYTLVGGSHCDFNDPGNRFCGLLCGQADPARTGLSQKYMTSWFNYYLYLRANEYTYLYGAESEADVDAGHIVRRVDTAPRGLAATAPVAAVRLDWTPYAHPIIAGYNVYRRVPGAGFGTTPYAQVGRTGAYTDTDVVAGQVYSYILRSRDANGNVHGAADEVSAIAQGGETPLWIVYLPLVVRAAD
jgi:dienelactone hydrolase